MTAAFATLNPDLLHLCLSHVGGVDAARAGAACKHWRAVASTERLWREICVKRWPSTAKLPRSPASHLEFYKQRTGRDYGTPTIALNRLTLLLDGQFGGGFSEALSFADATPCEVQTDWTEDPCHGFEWSVPATHELSYEATHELSYEGYDESRILETAVLRDDGKLARVGRVGSSDDKINWRFAVDLETPAETVTRIREEWFYLHFKLSGGSKLQVCASHCREDDEFDAPEEHTPYELNEVLALLDWR